MGNVESEGEAAPPSFAPRMQPTTFAIAGRVDTPLGGQPDSHHYSGTRGPGQGKLIPSKLKLTKDALAQKMPIRYCDTVVYSRNCLWDPDISGS